MLNKIKYNLLPAKLKKRWTFDDFLYYRMQFIDTKSIDSIMTLAELEAAEAKLNSDSLRHIFNSKRTFHEYFKKYIIRDVLFCDVCSLDVFTDFIQRHKKAIIKPDNMYAGKGVCVIELTKDNRLKIAQSESGDIIFSDNEDISTVYAHCHEHSYVLEEYIIQHSSLNNIAPSSLNTLRITTYIDKAGHSSILFAANQFGFNGSIVDNNYDYCFWGVIDINTGEIVEVETDDENGYVYERHPDTKAQVLGFINPNFEAIKKLALEASYQFPECRLVGWDIAIRADGRPEIVEGNVTPELDLYQAISQKGFRNILLSD